MKIQLSSRKGSGSYLEKQQTGQKREEKYHAGDNIGQSKRVFLQEFIITKQIGILLGGLSKEAAEGRTKYAPDRPYKGHNGKGSGLQFLLWHHLGYHGSDDTD